MRLVSLRNIYWSALDLSGKYSFQIAPFRRVGHVLCEAKVRRPLLVDSLRRLQSPVGILQL